MIARDLEALPIGNHRRPCPQCAKGKRDDALSVTVQPGGRGVWFCHRCGDAGGWGGWEEVRRSARPPSTPAVHAVASASAPAAGATLSGNYQAIWDAAQPIGGIARTYLEGRGCVVPPADGDLRWHPSVQAWGGVHHRGPALVALITDARTRVPISLHATFIARDGNGKAAIERTRLYAAAHRKAGGVVRLWPDESVATGLAVAEGIESALSGAHAIQPVWACLDAGNVASLPVLDGIDALTVLADHDPAGERAARECAERWARAGREVRIAMPPVAGSDFNDLATREAA